MLVKTKCENNFVNSMQNTIRSIIYISMFQ